MATLGTLRQTRIEDLQTEIRNLQNKMATFVVTRRTDEDEYLQNWEAVAAMQTEMQELKEERYAERASIVGPAVWPTQAGILATPRPSVLRPLVSTTID